MNNHELHYTFQGVDHIVNLDAITIYDFLVENKNITVNKLYVDNILVYSSEPDFEFHTDNVNLGFDSLVFSMFIKSIKKNN